MRASSNHQGAIRAREDTQRRMGHRWNDLVSHSIDKVIFKRLQDEEKVFSRRLIDLDRLHDHVHRQVQMIRHG